MADEQDAALAVGVHDRLIRGSRLKVVAADEPQVEIGDGVGLGRRGAADAGGAALSQPAAATIASAASASRG